MSEQTTSRLRRKTRTGVVVSDKMAKTVIVELTRRFADSLIRSAQPIEHTEPKASATQRPDAHSDGATCRGSVLHAHGWNCA